MQKCTPHFISGLVRKVNGRRTLEPDPHRPPLSRQVPRLGPSLQLSRLCERFQLSRQLRHEPGEQVRGLVGRRLSFEARVPRRILGDCFKENPDIFEGSPEEVE